MDETLGKRIIAHRKRLNMTQDKLAEQLGVTAQAVSKWENDQSCPDISMLPKLAGIFGISIDALLGIAAQETVHDAEVVQSTDEADAQEHDGIHIQKGNWDFTLDSSRKSSIGIALWVLLVGGLLLANSLFSWGAGFWDILWPSGLLVFGLLGVIPKFSLFRLGCLFFGAYFLLSNLNLAPFAMGKELLLPLFLLILGLILLMDALRKPKNRHFSFSHHGKNPKRSRCEVNGEEFVCNLHFGENDCVIETPRLHHGEASVSFGELTVDLSGCEEIAPGCFIDASCSFAELTIKAPRRYRVDADASTSFGNFEVNGTPDAAPEAVIRLNANINFGNICLEYI